MTNTFLSPFTRAALLAAMCSSFACGGATTTREPGAADTGAGDAGDAAPPGGDLGGGSPEVGAAEAPTTADTRGSDTASEAGSDSRGDTAIEAPTEAGGDSGSDVAGDTRNDTTSETAAETAGETASDLASEAGEVAPSPYKITTGKLPLYHLPKNVPNAKARNDASGIVFLPGPKQLLVIDDGGEDATPDVVPFYLTSVASLFAPPISLIEVPPAAELATALPARHRDMEALAFDGSWIYVMSSLPAASEKADAANRAFSRFKLDGTLVTQATTVDPREAIMAALAKPTADAWFADWLARWKDQKAKDGGLNVEAISHSPTAGKLLVGLRSPHYSADYLAPMAGDPTKKQTRVGPALVVQIDVADFDLAKFAPEVIARLDLGGLGFRGMEYSPAAGGYFITAGAVEAGFDYGFYFWNGQPGSAPVALSEKVPEWKKLCRPESVTELEHEGKKYLLVLSEESGAICEQPAAPYNYLLIELDDVFKAALK